MNPSRPPKRAGSRLLSLLLPAFFSVHLAAQPADNGKLRFSSLSIEDGLSQSTVFAIRQDKKGFLWIATADGLNKYDGYSFSTYRHNKNDSCSIQSDMIRNILVDENDKLWIGTGTGLSFYSGADNKFSNYRLNTGVNHICPYDRNTLWVATPEGVFRFDVNERTFSSLPAGGKKMAQSKVIARYNNLMLVGTESGLWMSPAGEEQFVPFSKALLEKNIMDILPHAGGLWVATEGDGIHFFADNGRHKHFKHVEGNKKSLSSNYVRSLCYDARGRLWAGTFGGLNIYNEETGDFDRYHNNETDKSSISQNSVRSLFLDNQGGMWIGTYYGGLNYYHALQNRFGRIGHLPFTNSLSDNVVSCIVEGRRGELWIGTNDNGINVYDIATRHFSYYKANARQTGLIASNNVKAILADNNRVYVGTHGGGLSILHRNTGKTDRYNTRNSSLGSDDVYAFARTKDGKIWIGTLNGLVVLNPGRGHFEAFVQDGFGQRLFARAIYTLFADSKDRLWIGSDSGVFLYLPEQKRLVHYAPGNTPGSLSEAHVNCIQEDSKRRIWIGTRCGLNLFDENTGAFTRYFTENGLPNNNIFGILQDSFGRLWISTNKGLSCFIPATETFRNYSLADGIQSNQFNHYAYCKTSDGEMYFGGINGITHFYPERLSDNPFTPFAVITQLNVFNKEVLPGDGTKILSKDISDTRRISLSPEQSSFSLKFTVPNYLSGKHNTFAYRLEPFEPEWNYTSGSRTASYSNLPHGEYTFRVKAANSDGKWNHTPSVLQIEVQPYWWETIHARLIFLGLIVGIVYFIISYIFHKQSFRNQLALERMEKEKMEEVNQMKLRFFINISHEFKTPLTLMISPLQEVVRRTTDKWTREQLKLVQRSANKLLYLVNQLMDYRRAELGVFELKATTQNPEEQVRDIMGLYERLAQQKRMDFALENGLGNRDVLYDPGYFSLILNNLLSNAFKFTPEGGKISIGLSEKQGNFVLLVNDTGCGLSNGQLSRIFDRFYQVNEENTGTGIGLSLVKRLAELHHGKIFVESTPGKGASFHIHFPQNRELYNEQELSGEARPNIRQHTSEEMTDLIYCPEERIENPQDNENKPLLLIVEDDAGVRDYLAANFTGTYRVEVAGDGEKALSVVRENDVSLVITDVMLPAMNGIKLCKSIKQNIRTCHIPVIMLTARSNQQDQLEGLSAGADDYVSKPFNLSILKTKVQNMLRGKQRTLEHYSQTPEVDPEKITFNAMDRELLEKAKAIVERNLANSDFSVDDFCKEMGMSRSNLHLKLKAVTGESTIDFIKKIRFNHACRLLRDGRYSIAEISTMVGFNTPSYFTTSFKKYFNLLPNDYVKAGKVS